MLLLAAVAWADPLYLDPRVYGVDDPAEAGGIHDVALAQLQTVLGAGIVQPPDATRSAADACAAMRCSTYVSVVVYHLFDRYYAHILALGPTGDILGDYDATTDDRGELGIVVGALARSVHTGHPVGPVARHHGQPGEIGHDQAPRLPGSTPEVPDTIVGFSLGLTEPVGDYRIAPGFAALWVMRMEHRAWFLEYNAGFTVAPDAWGCGGGGVQGDFGGGWFILPEHDLTPYLSARLGMRFEGANCVTALGAGLTAAAGAEVWRRSHARAWLELDAGGDLLTGSASFSRLGFALGVGF